MLNCGNACVENRDTFVYNNEHIFYTIKKYFPQIIIALSKWNSHSHQSTKAISLYEYSYFRV